MAEIAFHNVTKRFGETVALSDASFTIGDNEFFCFFGPPLSGKSTVGQALKASQVVAEREMKKGGYYK